MCVQLYMNRPGLINVLKVMELLVCPLARFMWYYNILISSLYRSLGIHLAGDLDALRSKSRYKGLDETGVIGVVYRHEFLLSVSWRKVRNDHDTLIFTIRYLYIVYVLGRVVSNMYPV